MRGVRVTLLTILAVYLPLGFYWYIVLGDTQAEREAWFVRGMMSVLVLMLAVQAVPGSRLRGPCVGVGVVGLIAMIVALTSPEWTLWALAVGILQATIVVSAILIAVGEEAGLPRRLGIALAGGTGFGLLWFVGLRTFFDDPGGPELAYASRVLGTEAAPLIPVGVSVMLTLWAWSGRH